MDLAKLRLTPDQLHRTCQRDRFDFRNTSELPLNRSIIGQDRGAAAIEFGISIDAPNFNLFVLGPTGSGRLTAVKHFINMRVVGQPAPDDACYVHNFAEPHRPRAIRLAAGQAPRFKEDMERLIQTLRSELQTLFQGESFRQAEKMIVDSLVTERDNIIRPVQERVTAKGFVLQQTPQGALMMIPVHDGQPVTPDILDSLSEEQRSEIDRNRRDLETILEDAFQQTRQLQERAEKSLSDLRQTFASQVIESHMAEIKKRYAQYGAVTDYMQAVQNDILNSLDEFQGADEESLFSEDSGQPGKKPLLSPTYDPTKRYAVNVLTSNDPTVGAPVVLLDLPTYQNLVGRIEHVTRFGMMTTDFTQIRPGALHEANGGFLIVRALDILQHPFAWEALERALVRGEIAIEEPDVREPTIKTIEHLQPEPIALDVKVVLVGSAELYYLLYNEDERFRELFQVKADFNSSMDRTSENEDAYALFISMLCATEELPHFDVGAVRRLIDYGSWMVGDQQKLSTQFGQLTPLIYEAVYWSKHNEHETIMAEDVEAAIQASTYRNNLLEELSHEQITDGTVFIDVTGEVVGQVNGLVVMQQGAHSFGVPNRVTARVYMGHREVVQIDRESRLTGPIHDKGVMILQGYLGGHYAQDYPLSLTATLSFEQNYGGVEGDSASSTELYALLSALAKMPIRQDIGVTGSVNQLGQIQPVGGVTQKIEGFFAICKQVGLTGSQGCIVPHANIRHLMLKQEVVQAVEDGQFHIYAIETVDEGISILTGRQASEIHDAVDKRLRTYADRLATFYARGAAFS